MTPSAIADPTSRPCETPECSWGLLTVTGLDTGQISTLLAGQVVPFSELSAHRATLEEAYLGLTQDAVEYRAEYPGGSGPPGSGVSPGGGVPPRAGTTGVRP
jgi:ABC-2 type transport system ATP-binding protein